MFGMSTPRFLIKVLHIYHFNLDVISDMKISPNLPRQSNLPTMSIPLANVCAVLSCSVIPTLCHPMDCSPPGSSVHGHSPGKNTGVGCLALLLQGIFIFKAYCGISIQSMFVELINKKNEHICIKLLQDCLVSIRACP